MSLGGLYALMALGLVIVYGILRLVNFAYGELVMVAGYGLLVLGDTPLPWLICAALSIIAAMIAGRADGTCRVSTGSEHLADDDADYIVRARNLLQNIALLSVSPRPRAPRLPDFFVDSVTIGDLRIKHGRSDRAHCQHPRTGRC